MHSDLFDALKQILIVTIIFLIIITSAVFSNLISLGNPTPGRWSIGDFLFFLFSGFSFDSLPIKELDFQKNIIQIKHRKR